jgi:hypothetical protein
MADLEALPNELLARIVAFSNRKSLAQLRLTSKRLEDIAVSKLFERVTLYAHWTRGEARNLGGHVYENGYSEDERSEDEWEGRMQGFIASSDPEEDDDDGFVAGSEMDADDLIQNGDEDLNLRPHLSDERSMQEESTDEVDLSTAEANDRSPRPHPVSGRLSDLEAYNETCRLKWELSRPQWARENYPGPPDYDAAMFLNIVEDERLKKFVKKVHVYTCETHCVRREIIWEVQVC